jgi:hypothetical protein
MLDVNLTDAEIDVLLARFDQTEPAKQRRIVAYFVVRTGLVNEACRAALPILEWANIHGSRCEEVLAQVKAALPPKETAPTAASL